VFFCGIVSHAALFVHVDDVRNTENIVTMTACCKVAVAVQHSGTGRGKDVNCAQVEVCVECVGGTVCVWGQACWDDSVAHNLRLQICVALRWGYVLRNASFGDFVVVRTSYSVLTQSWIV
jgi:hypothetical protein